MPFFLSIFIGISLLFSNVSRGGIFPCEDFLKRSTFHESDFTILFWMKRIKKIEDLPDDFFKKLLFLPAIYFRHSQVSEVWSFYGANKYEIDQKLKHTEVPRYWIQYIEKYSKEGTFEYQEKALFLLSLIINLEMKIPESFQLESVFLKFLEHANENMRMEALETIVQLIRDEKLLFRSHLNDEEKKLKEVVFGFFLQIADRKVEAYTHQKIKSFVVIEKYKEYQYIEDKIQVFNMAFELLKDRLFFKRNIEFFKKIHAFLGEFLKQWKALDEDVEHGESFTDWAIKKEQLGMMLKK